MKTTALSTAAAAVLTANHKRPVMVKKRNTMSFEEIQRYVSGEKVKASSVDGTNDVPTGRMRFMHAVACTKDAFYKTIQGKRIPAGLTNRQRAKQLRVA